MNKHEFSSTCTTHYMDDSGNKYSFLPISLNEPNAGPIFLTPKGGVKLGGTYYLYEVDNKLIIRFQNNFGYGKIFFVKPNAKGLTLISTENNDTEVILEYDIVEQEKCLLTNINKEGLNFLWGK